MRRKLGNLISSAAIFFFVLLLGAWGYSYIHSLTLQWQSRHYDGKTRIDYETSLEMSRGVARPHIYAVRETVGVAQLDTFSDSRCYLGPAFDVTAPHFIGNFLGFDAWIWSWHKPVQSIYNIDLWLPGWLLLVPPVVIALKLRASAIRRHRRKLGQCRLRLRPACQRGAMPRVRDENRRGAGASTTDRPGNRSRSLVGRPRNVAPMRAPLRGRTRGTPFRCQYRTPCRARPW